MAKLVKHAKKIVEDPESPSSGKILEDLEARVDVLEEMLGSLREEFEMHKQQLNDAGIRLST